MVDQLSAGVLNLVKRIEQIITNDMVLVVIFTSDLSFFTHTKRGTALR